MRPQHQHARLDERRHAVGLRNQRPQRLGEARIAQMLQFLLRNSRLLFSLYVSALQKDLVGGLQAHEH